MLIIILFCTLGSALVLSLYMMSMAGKLTLANVLMPVVFVTIGMVPVAYIGWREHKKVDNNQDL